MLNKYPMWKNLLVLLIVLLGFIYAIPNLYPDDEAIQVNNEFGLITDADLERATTALEAAQLNFSVRTSMRMVCSCVSQALKSSFAVKQL